MAVCQISGIVLNGEGEAAANISLRFTPLSITGVAMSVATVHAKTNAAGQIQDVDSINNYVELIQGGTYRLNGPILGGYNDATGENIQIPSAATADFSDLISVAAIPSEGLTVRDDNVIHGNLIGDIDFVGFTITYPSAGRVRIEDTGGAGSSTLAALTDVSLSSLASGDYLRYSGSAWVNRTPAQVKTDLALNLVENAAASGLYSVLAHTHTFASLTSKPTTLSGYGITDAEALANKATNFATVNDTLYPTVAAVKSYADSLVVGLLDDRGSFDASGNVFPSSGGSGSAGAILKGDLWFISVAGTLGGSAVGVGDSVRALVDSPGQTASNWAVVEANIGFVPENVANKATSFSTLNNTLYPSTQAVANYAQPLSSNLTTFSGIAPSANVQTLLGAANFAAFRTSLGVAIGSDVQAFSSRLSEVAVIGLANQQIRVNGAGNALEYFTPSSGGTTINATDGVLPYRSNSTTFADSPITRLSASQVQIGTMVTGTWSIGGGAYAVIRNAAMAETDYAFIQENNGATYFNAKSGTSMNFNIGASNRMALTSMSFKMVSGGTFGFVSGGDATVAADTLWARAAAASHRLYGEDAVTNAITNTLVLGHNSSGTPAAGFGGGMLFQLKSSTTADQDAAQIAAEWTTATHASRTSDLVFKTVNNAAALAEAFRLKGDLSAVFAGVPRFNGTNSTGAGSALLGANSPAVTLTAPYTWISAKAADGSDVFIPAWK